MSELCPELDPEPEGRTTVSLCCFYCGKEEHYVDRSSPVEEVLIDYWNLGWCIGEDDVCPDCNEEEDIAI